MALLDQYMGRVIRRRREQHGLDAASLGSACATPRNAQVIERIETQGQSDLAQDGIGEGYLRDIATVLGATPEEIEQEAKEDKYQEALAEARQQPWGKDREHGRVIPLLDGDSLCTQPVHGQGGIDGWEVTVRRAGRPQEIFRL